MNINLALTVADSTKAEYCRILKNEQKSEKII